jgi:hypothetical protein
VLFGGQGNQRVGIVAKKSLADAIIFKSDPYSADVGTVLASDESNFESNHMVLKIDAD